MNRYHLATACSSSALNAQCPMLICNIIIRKKKSGETKINKNDIYGNVCVDTGFCKGIVAIAMVMVSRNNQTKRETWMKIERNANANNIDIKQCTDIVCAGWICIILQFKLLTRKLKQNQSRFFCRIVFFCKQQMNKGFLLHLFVLSFLKIPSTSYVLPAIFHLPSSFFVSHIRLRLAFNSSPLKANAFYLFG